MYCNMNWIVKHNYEMSNTTDTYVYTYLCTKITCGNTFGNGGNTRGNDDNTCGKSCHLKLNDMDCNVNCHVGFGAQVGI